MRALIRHVNTQVGLDLSSLPPEAFTHFVDITYSRSAAKSPDTLVAATDAIAAGATPPPAAPPKTAAEVVAAAATAAVAAATAGDSLAGLRALDPLDPAAHSYEQVTAMFVVDVSSLMPAPVKVQPALPAPAAAAEGAAAAAGEGVTGDEAQGDEAKADKMQVDAAAAGDEAKEEAAADAMEADTQEGAAAEAANGDVKEGADTAMTDAEGGDKVSCLGGCAECWGFVHTNPAQPGHSTGPAVGHVLVEGRSGCIQAGTVTQDMMGRGVLESSAVSAATPCLTSVVRAFTEEALFGGC